MSTSSFLILLIIPFWFVIMLLYYIIISLRLSISWQNSSQLIPPLLYLGKVKTLTIGNGGSIYCVAYSLVYGAVIYYLNYADLKAVRVLSNC